MDFSLTEEQVLLRDSIEKFIREHCDVERHRRLLRSSPGYDPETWRTFAELGWLCMPFSEAQGGFGGGAVDIMVMAEAMGKGLIREPFLPTVVTCGGFLQCAGDEAQQDRYISGIISGQSQWAFAFAEHGSGYDMSRPGVRAESGSPGYILSGTKLSVLNGASADFLIVTAATEAGPSLFVVDASQPGVRRESFMAVDGSYAAHVHFDQVALAPEQLLGVAGEANSYIDQVLARTMVAMGAEALGAMQVLLDTTVEYTRTREQFGQPIGKFQALQHRMADMHLKIEETRSLLLNAAILLDEGSEEAVAACLALKVKFAETGRLVSQEAVQLHGGIGMTDELSVGHYFKRLMLLGLLYGDEDHCLERYMALTA
ncbi:acyl-CoA dehydrogenase family protein [Microbulbifer sp. SA54]|uniref:acyl-CoA dehydrogenase family protein n=1 Tax=Microbulbifer sp. SA54 TaxID=3401577 RepID=UPI003AABB47A